MIKGKLKGPRTESQSCHLELPKPSFFPGCQRDYNTYRWGKGTMPHKYTWAVTIHSDVILMTAAAIPKVAKQSWEKSENANKILMKVNQSQQGSYLIVLIFRMIVR